MAINDSLPGKLAAGAALVRVFAVGRWAVIDTGIHATGDYEFCTSCHDTMGAIGAACREDIHGGNNATGLRAEGTACHLGPDHPNIEIYNNSKHGHIYHSDSADWKWDAPPDAWEPGDYRAPCHMSGIGSLVTHNASDRHYWNLWAPATKVLNELREKGLLKENPSTDEFQSTTTCGTTRAAEPGRAP